MLEILALPARRPAEAAFNFVMSKQYYSITPQAVSVWCRQMGHQPFYATYYGLGDPRRWLPSDLDVILISSYTWASSLAYALAKWYRGRGVRTVIGGPHAKAFPADCLRFFDLAVKECDRDLVRDILADRYPPGSVISSRHPMSDVPTVEERLPEIRRAAFLWQRRRTVTSNVPLLASVGCPYSCSFCIDWNNPYRLMPLERLEADLRFISSRLPGVVMSFHDPNFGIKFDEVVDVLESVPQGRRTPYVMECSLTNLRGRRIARLGETNCVAVAPGIESWAQYAHKAATKGMDGRAKVAAVADHFRRLHEYVPYLQANFIFGLDADAGEEPVELTKEFMRATPFVWPTLNIPIPFGNTPLFDELLAEDRILTPMPFTFYGSHLVTTPKHYDPAGYYERLVELADYSSSWAMLKRRMTSTGIRTVKLVHWTRSMSNRSWSRSNRRLAVRLRTDRELRTFHEGRSPDLPQLYHRWYERALGQFAPLISPQERIPTLDPGPVPLVP